MFELEEVRMACFMALTRECQMLLGGARLVHLESVRHPC